MRGHNIWFNAELSKLIPNYHQNRALIMYVICFGVSVRSLLGRVFFLPFVFAFIPPSPAGSHPVFPAVLGDCFGFRVVRWRCINFLWETARYRLKYCLKGPLNLKQPTNLWCPFMSPFGILASNSLKIGPYMQYMYVKS